MSGFLSFGQLGRYCMPFLVSVLLSAGVVRLTLAEQNTASGASLDAALSIESVLQAVKQNDYRLKQFKEESQALLAESEAAGYLPDPTVFAALQSLPTDTFDLDQEPMTQLRMGLRQMFPKGDVLEITSELSSIQSELQLIARQQHWLERKKQVEQDWLEAWYWQKSLSLLEEDRIFLEQIQTFIRSLYEVGAKEQSDVIGADLELVRLKEKQIAAKRQYLRYRQKLDTLAHQKLGGVSLIAELPDLKQIDYARFEHSALASLLAQHPHIEMLNQKMVLAEKKVELVQQDFEPAWGLELSYGVRDGNNMDGSARPDFVSAGVNLQLPLFSKGKQGQNQKAALQRTSVAQMMRDEALSQMRFEVDNLLQQYRNTHEQRALYERELLPTLEKQRKSALQSYEADQASFSLVMGLFLKEQNAQTMHQRLRVNEQKLLSSLNYLLGIDATQAKHGAHSE